MTVRICALSVPHFYDGGIEVGVGWSTMPDELTEEQRAVLLERVGTLIQVHPDDVGNLGEHGLKLVRGKLHEAADDVGDIETGIEKSDAKRTKNKGARGAGKD